MKRIAAIATTLILTVVILMPSGMWDVFAEPVVLKDSSRGIGVEESGSAPERDRSLQDTLKMFRKATMSRMLYLTPAFSRSSTLT